MRWCSEGPTIGVVGNLVKRIETGGPQARKLMKKVVTGDRKVGELVKKIQINDPKAVKVWNLVRFGQEKYKKPVQDAMLAAGEDEFIKRYRSCLGCEGSTRRRAELSE